MCGHIFAVKLSRHQLKIRTIIQKVLRSVFSCVLFLTHLFWTAVYTFRVCSSTSQGHTGGRSTQQYFSPSPPLCTDSHNFYRDKWSRKVQPSPYLVGLRVEVCILGIQSLSIPKKLREKNPSSSGFELTTVRLRGYQLNPGRPDSNGSQQKKE